jgi:hypothetical protein
VTRSVSVRVAEALQRLDNNNKTVAIAAAGDALYQLHNDGWIWRYTGTPCSGESCPGWQRLDHNNKTVAIIAAGNNLYQPTRPPRPSPSAASETACSGQVCLTGIRDNGLSKPAIPERP